MGIFRIYAQKNNTIASGKPYEKYNSSFNEICNLWYGGGSDSIIDSSTMNSISRFLIYFDLTELNDKINSKEIMIENIDSFVLKMKNCLPSDELLETVKNSYVPPKFVANSFDLIAFPINKYWDGGVGYDLNNNIYVAKSNGSVYVTGYSNWNYATSLTTWTEPGIYTNPTASTPNYTIQHFDVGDEDLEMDVTKIVNSWLTGGSQNNGICVCFARPYELISGDTRNIASFFTKHTNTAFKPFLEVNYDQTIKDDRFQFNVQNVNRLFLFTYSQNQPINYFSAGTVNIQDYNGNVLSSYSPNQMQTGVYYVDVYLPNANPGDILYDVWKGVTFNPGYDVQDFAQEFVVKQNLYKNNSKGVNQYSLRTYGLENNAIIDYDGIIRIYVESSVNFTNNNAYVPYGLQYKMIMNNKDEIIPWTDANFTNIDNTLTYFFDLDTSWLINNQTYKISFKINELGTKKVVEENIYFRVLKQKALQ